MPAWCTPTPWRSSRESVAPNPFENVAPAMRAANMSIDDGIALLNVFGAKGLDAGQASAAFAKALTKVKSPKELQDLITDISNTKDPFERAAKAAARLATSIGSDAKARLPMASVMSAVATSSTGAQSTSIPTSLRSSPRTTRSCRAARWPP